LRKADAPPGTIGDIVGPDVWITCDDEWMSVTKVWIDGGNADAAEVLRTKCDFKMDGTDR
jgi:hypothetical protein